MSLLHSVTGTVRSTDRRMDKKKRSKGTAFIGFLSPSGSNFFSTSQPQPFNQSVTKSFVSLISRCHQQPSATFTSRLAHGDLCPSHVQDAASSASCSSANDRRTALHFHCRTVTLLAAPVWRADSLLPGHASQCLEVVSGSRSHWLPHKAQPPGHAVCQC